MSDQLPTLRRSDWSLTDVQEDLRATVRQFFERECPIERVRADEPVAFDAPLWQQVRDLDLFGIGLPQDRGGAGGDLVDLVLVAEERGRALAPVPLVEHAVALRVLAALDVVPPGLFGGVRDGSMIATFAPLRQRGALPVLVPYASEADIVLGSWRDDVVLLRPGNAEAITSLGGTPLARCVLSDPGVEMLLAGSEAVRTFDRALAEWKVLTAASLIGLACGALDLAVAYANERVAFGVQIGTFQALSHPLADVLTAIEGARRLVMRAAWYLEYEPDEAGLHVAVAWLHATETANRAASVGIHTQGGFGFTLESDLHLFFRRAKTWACVAGDPREDLTALADLSFGPAGTVSSGPLGTVSSGPLGTV
jgi:alkylation response protein AidB-like acyl-CoA dehydrogenase